MLYQDARAKIKSGDLLLFNGRGPFAWLIREVTESHWAHCGVAWVVGARVFILESRVLTGVAIRSLSRNLPCGWIATDKWGESAENFALSRLQQPYSIVDAVRVGLKMKPSRDGLVCSTFAGRIYEAAGEQIDFTGLTPARLAERFGDNPIFLE